MTRLNTLFLGTAMTLGLAISAPAFAGDFTALDSNQDGQVTFAEYRAHAKTLGISQTQAAQDFTRMSQGDAIITQDEFFLADAMADQPYALRAVGTPAAYEAPTETLSAAPVEFVEPAPVSANEPVSYEVEVYSPPVTEAPAAEETPVETEVTPEPMPEIELSEGETSDSLETIKPLEDVAGEVVTSDDIAPMEEVTPLEEGTVDLEQPLENSDDTDVDTDAETEPELGIETSSGDMN